MPSADQWSIESRYCQMGDDNGVAHFIEICKQTTSHQLCKNNLILK